jgi:hypothetical protein
MAFAWVSDAKAVRSGLLGDLSMVAVTSSGGPHDGRKLDKLCAHRTNGAPGSAGQGVCVVRDRIELSTFRFSGGRSYRLSYLTLAMKPKA